MDREILVRIELECITYEEDVQLGLNIYIYRERESCQGTECVRYDMIKDGDSLNERQRIKKGRLYKCRASGVW